VERGSPGAGCARVRRPACGGVLNPGGAPPASEVGGITRGGNREERAKGAHVLSGRGVPYGFSVAYRWVVMG
jgi:hypothetical protein